MYWTDRRLEKIFSATSKPNQTQVILSPTTVAAGYEDLGKRLKQYSNLIQFLGDILAFDPLAQPKATSPCHITDNLRKPPCPQLCFAMPNSATPTCDCARGIAKGRTCEGTDLLDLKTQLNFARLIHKLFRT